MKFKVFTVFPNMLESVVNESIIGRARAQGLIEIERIDIREYTEDKHRRTDDYPFGGGAGMVMTAQPIVDAMRANAPSTENSRRIYLSPRGQRLDQRLVERLSRYDEIHLLCGHYEGVDERAVELCVDEEISIGDYVLTGGELGAMVVIDAVSRLVPGVLGSDESNRDESFATGLLEYPQYTRPREFCGLEVPEVLLGGNHALINSWRREMALITTLERRPDLLADVELTDKDRKVIDAFRAVKLSRND